MDEVQLIGTNTGPAALEGRVGRASGKAILVGEHFVVHGGPALAVPIGAEITVVLRQDGGWSGPEIGVRGILAMAAELGVDLSPLAAAPLAAEPGDVSPLAAVPKIGGVISGDLPLGAGLGGSAALAAAWLRALGVSEGLALAEAIHRCEKVAHGRPSGLDGLTVATGKPIWMPRSSGEVVEGPLGRAGGAVVLDEVEVPLVVAVVPRRGTTREAVALVGERRVRDPETFSALAETTAELADAARVALIEGDWPALGRALDEAHAPLWALGLVSPEQEILVSAARAAGALGAKMSGAGLGGAVVALARDARSALDLMAVLRQAGAVHVFGQRAGR